MSILSLPDRRTTIFQLALGYEKFLQGLTGTRNVSHLSKDVRNHYVLFDEVVANTAVLSPISPIHAPSRPESARHCRFRSICAIRAVYSGSAGVRRGLTDDPLQRRNRVPGGNVLMSTVQEDGKNVRIAPNNNVKSDRSEMAGLKWRSAAALTKFLNNTKNEEGGTQAAQMPCGKRKKRATVENTRRTTSRASRAGRVSQVAGTIHAWDSVLPKVFESNQDKKLLIRKQKDACNSLRMLVFGCLLNENRSAGEQNTIYEECCGTKLQVKKLWEIWKRMDIDGSGDVGLDEFVKFFSTNKADRLLSWRAVQYLVYNGRTATIEDFMKLIWSKAEDEHIELMMCYFRECAADDQRVKTPRLISRRIRRQLRETFRYLGKNGDKNISYSDMVDANLVDEETANALIKQFDKNGDGRIDEKEFLEMMAPSGTRAYEDQKECFDSDGNTIEYIESSWFTGWRTKDALSGFNFAAADE
eukprot:GEMP01044174.1.p1 GENE.GEMP01044174.1~~GEMP01044174.1.p1  ORF type:complete len:484 (+),score=81.11 GEMP01044174.1:37-1452(+)